MSTQAATVNLAPGKQSNSQSPIVKFFSIENRYLPPIFITLILLVGNLSFGLLESFSRTALAIGVAMLFEVGLGLLVYRKIPNLASAYISGISVGILMRSPEFWPYALCSAIAITSKYAIRWRGRHLWNPSNLAISVMLLLVPEFVATLSVQWGNSIWPMLIVWVLGRADSLSSQTTAHHSYICSFLRRSFATPDRLHGRFVFGGGGTHHRAHVSVIYFLHDYGPQNHRKAALGAVPGGVPGRAC